MALYVLSGFLPVVAKTTSPPIRKAISAVKIGVITPPERCHRARRAAKEGTLLAGVGSDTSGVWPVISGVLAEKTPTPPPLWSLPPPPRLPARPHGCRDRAGRRIHPP